MTTTKGEIRTPPARAQASWKAVALPVEHGSWSLLLEPVILGLVLVPSLAGFCLALAALAAFLTRQPLRLLALDLRRHATYPRTRLARRFALGYGAFALILAGAAFQLASTSLAAVIAAAAPFALVALAFDLSGRGREVVAELSGSLALAASAAAITLAGGGSSQVAWVASLLVSLRSVTAVLYVRARLRHERSQRASAFGAIAAHLAALILVAGLVLKDQAPRLALAAFAVLLARAAHGLSGRPAGLRPQTVGIHEVAYGVTALIAVALGFRFAW